MSGMKSQPAEYEGSKMSGRYMNDEEAGELLGPRMAISVLYIPYTKDDSTTYLHGDKCTMCVHLKKFEPL